MDHDFSFPANFPPQQVKIIKEMGAETVPIPVPVEQGGTNSQSSEEFREKFSLVIGEDVQEQNNVLQQISDLSNPEESSLYFYDHSENKIDFLSVGTNLTINDKTLNASGGGGGGVTEVNTGAGLTGGPITSTGIISLAPGTPLKISFLNKTDTFSTSSTSFVEIPDLSHNFTKENEDVSIFGIVNLNCAVSNDISYNPYYISIFRNGTPIFYGDLTDTLTTPVTIVSSSFTIRNSNASFHFEDNPVGIDDLTYQIFVKATFGNPFYLNRSVEDPNLDYYCRCASSFLIWQMSGEA